METTSPNLPATLPTMSAQLMRGLAGSVVVANGVALITAAGMIVALKRPDWWPALIAAGVIALICVAGSVVVLSKAAGRTIDWLVTFVMGTSAVRMGVSLVGLMVSVKGFDTPAEATGFLICAFYALTLIVETLLLSRITRKSAADAGGMMAAGNTAVGDTNVA